ncbi:MAG: peptidoglycan-binding protein [Acidobacteria bacterium]|nr:peptidoglycan-binding protein [Acidobacteriota bacterium]
MAYKETKHWSGDMKYYFNVSKSVGPGRTNNKTDVALVQTLLRNCYDGNEIANLQIDGDCGPKTRAAIKKFQIEFSLHSVKAGHEPLEQDGIVTRADNFGFDGPGGNIVAYTIVALNFTLKNLKPKVWENLPYSPNVPAYLRVELMKTKG